MTTSGAASEAQSPKPGKQGGDDQPWKRRLRRALPLVLAGYAAVALSGFLADGLPSFFDGHSHLTRVWMVSEALQDGRLPQWSQQWYGGYRLLSLNSPLYYGLTGALDALLDDTVGATKIVLFAGQVLSVVVFYGFVLRATGSLLGAVLATLLFVGCPGRAWVLGVTGSHPTVLVYLLLAALLAHTPRLLGPSRLAGWAGQSLLLGGLLLAHLQSVFLLPAALAYQALWLWQEAGPKRQSAGVALLAGGLGALALSAFLWLPMLIELPRVALSLDVAPPPAWAASVTPLAILAGLAPESLDHVYLRNLGLGWWALAGAVALCSLHPGARRHRPLALGLAVSVASVMWVDRSSLGLTLFLFPLCAAGVGLASDALSGAGPLARAAPGVLAIGIALAPLGPQAPTPRYQAADSLDVYASLPGTPTPGRTFDVTPTSLSLDGFYGQSSFSPAISGRAIPFGAFPQGAPLASQVSVALLGKLAASLGGDVPRLDAVDLDLLYLAHVEFLVDRSERPSLGRLTIATSRGELHEGHVLALRYAGPALFAPRLDTLPDGFPQPDESNRPALLGILEERWREGSLIGGHEPSVAALARPSRGNDWQPLIPLVESMKIDREGGTATRIFVERLLASGEIPSAQVPRFEVLQHGESEDLVIVKARAGAGGFVRLSYAYDPDLRIRLDGEVAEAVPDALGGAVVVAFPAGVHTLELRPPKALLRTGLLAGSLALCAVLVALLARGPRHLKGEST